MPIPCPAIRDVDEAFNIDGVGVTALAALIDVFTDLQDWIDRITECEEPCIRFLGEPKWTLRRFTLTQNADGTWVCQLWGGYQNKVECRLPEQAPIEVGYEEQQAKS